MALTVVVVALQQGNRLDFLCILLWGGDIIDNSFKLAVV